MVTVGGVISYTIESWLDETYLFPALSVTAPSEMVISIKPSALGEIMRINVEGEK
jgi:hypothetical protein